MASDISGNDETRRGIVFGLIHMLRQAGIVISFVIGYPILNRDITDYSRVMLAVAIVSAVLVLLIIFILRDTTSARDSEQQPLTKSAPTSGAGETAPASDDRNVIRKVCGALAVGAKEMWAAVRLVGSDKYLSWQLL